MTERLEEGYRADLATVAAIHDVDGHQVAVDFPHEVLDNYRTDWGRGCWDESFARRLPVMVWNHNPDLLIGAGLRTESLGDRSRVVQRFADFDAVPQARAAHSMITDQIVPGFSFHFRNGRSVPHPNVRGARRYVKADMLEVSPVTFPSIPGAVAVGIRSEEATTLEVPTIDDLIRLRDQRVIDDDGMRSLIAEHHPMFREHIKATTTGPAEPSVAEKVELLLGDEHGLRDLVIHIGSDGSVSTSSPQDGDTGGADGDDDAATLAAAVDAALDEFANLIGGVDVTSLPDPVQQAVALAQAAGVAADELLEVMGVDDPDDGGDRTAMSQADQDNLPDSDFAYIESGGTKDGSGKTVPRKKRHLPINDAAHVRNALARFDQTEFESDQAQTDAKAKIEAAAKKFGVHTSDAAPGKRSDDSADEPVDDGALTAALDAALERLAKY